MKEIKLENKSHTPVTFWYLNYCSNFEVDKIKVVSVRPRRTKILNIQANTYLLGLKVFGEYQIPRCFYTSVKITFRDPSHWYIKFDSPRDTPEIPENIHLWFNQWLQYQYQRSHEMKNAYQSGKEDKFYSLVVKNFIQTSFTQIPIEYLTICYLQNQGEEITWPRVKELTAMVNRSFHHPHQLYPITDYLNPEVQQKCILKN